MTMSVASQQVRASFAFVERNWNLVRRYWAWELVWLAYSIANSLAVSYIGLGMEVLTGSSTIDTDFLVLYLLIGTLVWRYLSSIFSWVTEVIAIERWEGTIEYTLMAPVPRLVHLVGHTSFAVV
jgi:ABC-2 type transport system permease protein